MGREVDKRNSKLVEKRARLKRDQQWRRRIVAIVGVLTVACAVLCGYGHAAVSTDLLISGVGMVDQIGFRSDYMQDLTATECKNVSQYTQKQMIDKRDGQKYWVIKYGDGNCWMAQDLKLKLSTDTILTSELSDVNDDWAPDYDTLETVSTVLNNAKGTRSYDFGDFVQLPKTSNCGVGKTTLAQCTNQFKDVSALTPSNDPNFYETNGNMPYNDTKYDAHFLVGTYYQFNAATAGTGGALSTANARATASVCPRGWNLPTGISSRTDTDMIRLINLEGQTSINVLIPPFYYNKAGQVYTSASYKLREPGGIMSYASSNVSSASARYVRHANNGVAAVDKAVATNLRCVLYGE